MTFPDLTSPLPAPDHDRHRGFLNWNRRVLAAGSVACTCALLSLPALPASAQVVVAEAHTVTLQSYAAPAMTFAPAVARDAFTVTEFTLVQWPVAATTTLTSETTSDPAALREPTSQAISPSTASGASGQASWPAAQRKSPASCNMPSSEGRAGPTAWLRN